MVGAALSVAGSSQKTKVEDLNWMAGAWSCPMWGGTFEEYWTPVAGETMQGCGRLVANGKTSFMEFMSIESDASGITMYMMLNAPSKGEKKPVPFKLASYNGKSAIFENAKNDFPSKIVYVKDGTGMSCYIEGMQNGKKSKEDFAFKRMAMGG
ncbi:MAG: hypothetical protein H7Y17_10615 [Chlorobia bacterium]|nr:hypothetical protein [Fimbriimonadaceae bacterium]